MARKDGKAEVQHTVPQLLLRLHASDPAAKRGAEQVWCFDKKTEKIYASNIKGILAETRFYEADFNGDTVSLEQHLTDIEEKAAPVLTRIVQERTVSGLSNYDRRCVAVFIATQFIRTKVARDQILDVSEWLATSLKEGGIDPDKVPNFGVSSDLDAKRLSLEMVLDAPLDYAPHFLDKHWYLIEATPDDPFHLGDHPVVRENEFAAVGGKMGLASPGIVIYLPLCPTLCLGMMDARIANRLRKNLVTERRKLETVRRRATKLSRRSNTQVLVGMIREVETIARDMRTRTMMILNGGPIPYDPDFVTRKNALQMAHATRWVISSREDFSLPKSMLADSERYRRSAPVFGPALTPRKRSAKGPPTGGFGVKS
jgi:hypothetical protein